MNAMNTSQERPEPLVAAFDGRVYGMDPLSGQRLWVYEADARFQATVRLGVEQGRVFALMPSALVCLDLASGSVIWRVAPAGPGDTLLVRGGFVFIGRFGEVRAHSASNGQALWNDAFKGKGMGHVALAFRGVIAQADETK